jgi:hypothetical protein
MLLCPHGILNITIKVAVTLVLRRLNSNCHQSENSGNCAHAGAVMEITEKMLNISHIFQLFILSLCSFGHAPQYVLRSITIKVMIIAMIAMP